MISVFENPVCIHKAYSLLIQELMIPDMIMIVVIHVTYSVWLMEHRFSTHSSFLRSLVGLLLTGTECESMQNRDSFSLPPRISPEITEGRHTAPKTPYEWDEGNEKIDSDAVTVYHLLMQSESRSERNDWSELALHNITENVIQYSKDDSRRSAWSIIFHVVSLASECYFSLSIKSGNVYHANRDFVFIIWYLRCLQPNKSKGCKRHRKTSKYHLVHTVIVAWLHIRRESDCSGLRYESGLLR